jgi:quinol monooxygenase YgiN
MKMTKYFLWLTILFFPFSSILGGEDMSDHVFVVSEWLAKENHDQELWERAKEIMKLTLQNEKGCLRAHAWRQISHPGSPGKSKYTIVLHQEYVNVEAFDLHCQSHYVSDFFTSCIENKDTAIVADWCCRLFAEK